MENNILGTSIKEARENLGITQKKLASLCNITPVYLCRIEAGIHRPSVQTLRLISYCLQSDLSEVLQKVGYSNDEILKINDFSSLSPQKDLMSVSIQEFFSTYNDLPYADKFLVHNFFAKFSKLSERDKSIIRLILNSRDA